MPGQTLSTSEIANLAGLSGEAKPLARDDVAPAQCPDLLAQNGLHVDAIKFLAHSMEIKAAIDWACKCVRALSAPDQKPEEDASLTASEAWLKEPDDAKRRAAKAAAEESGMARASDCVAQAVFFSGGSITDADSPPADPPPYAAHKFVAGAVQLAVVSYAPEKQAERYPEAIRLAKS